MDNPSLEQPIQLLATYEQLQDKLGSALEHLEGDAALQVQGLLDSAMADVLESAKTNAGYLTGLVANHQAKIVNLTETARLFADDDKALAEAATISLDNERDRATADPELELAIFYVGSLGGTAVAETTQVVVTQSGLGEAVDGTVGITPSKAPEAGHDAPSVDGAEGKTDHRRQVSFGVEVNESGRSYLVMKGSRNTRKQPLSDKFAGQVAKDYSAEKLAAVHIMTQAAGKEVSVTDLWSQMSVFLGTKEPTGETPPTDRVIMRSVRTFINDLRFGGQIIFRHNGKRGPSSGYRVDANFSRVPVSEITVDDIRSMQEAIKQRHSRAELEAQNLALPEAVPTIEEIFKLVGYLDLRGEVMDAYAARLDQTDGANNKLAAFLRLREELLPMVNDLFPGGQPVEHQSDLTQERVGIYNKLIRLIDDQALLLETQEILQESPEDHHFVALFLIDAMIDFTVDEREALKALLQMHVVNDPKVYGGSHSAGIQVLDIEQVFEIDGRKWGFDEKRELVERVHETAPKGVSEPEGPEDQPVVLTPPIEGQNDDEAQIATEGADDIDGTGVAPEAEPEEVLPTRGNTRKRNKQTAARLRKREKNRRIQQETEAQVRRIVAEAKDAGLASGAKPGQVRSLLRIQNLGNEIENVLRRPITADTVFSLSDIAVIAAYRTTRNTPVWEALGNQKRLLKAVQAIVTEAQEVEDHQ